MLVSKRLVWAFVLESLRKKETDNKRMARGKQTGHKLTGRGPGRPKGSKDKIPRASMKAMVTKLALTEPAKMERRFRRGLDAKPPYSAPYFRLAFEYLDGKPLQTVEVREPQPFRIILQHPTPEGEE